MSKAIAWVLSAVSVFLATTSAHSAPKTVTLTDYCIVSAEFGEDSYGYSIPSGSSIASAEKLYQTIQFTQEETQMGVKLKLAGVESMMTVYGLQCQDKPARCSVFYMVKSYCPDLTAAGKVTRIDVRGQVAKAIYNAMPETETVLSDDKQTIRSTGNMGCTRTQGQGYVCSFSDVSIVTTSPLTELLTVHGAPQLKSVVRDLNP